MFLLALSVVALGIGWLRFVTQAPQLPRGSSYSTQPDGAQGVYLWLQSLGDAPRRLQQPLGPADSQPSVLFIIQPEAVPSEADRREFDEVARHGGTIVLAGDSIPSLVYARSLGAALELAADATPSLATPDGASRLAAAARFRVRASNATPLLVFPDGDAAAVRMPYQQGNLVVIATSEVLTNSGLRDRPTAQFVLRELLGGGSVPGGVAFDEVHHSFAPAEMPRVTLNELLFSTPAGRAILYAAGLTFAFLVLSGRRLGPPLQLHGPTETRRTMYEHVQMLAGLYRRAGQLSAAHAAFMRHYARLGRQAEDIQRIERARTQADLIAAVAAADDAG